MRPYQIRRSHEALMKRRHKTRVIDGRAKRIIEKIEEKYGLPPGTLTVDHKTRIHARREASYRMHKIGVPYRTIEIMFGLEHGVISRDIRDYERRNRKASDDVAASEDVRDGEGAGDHRAAAE